MRRVRLDAEGGLCEGEKYLSEKETYLESGGITSKRLKE